MSIKLTLNKLFVFSEETNKYFSATFSEWVNIIHWRNTSWKSTLMQSIIYALWMNDSKVFLNEILDLGVFFRVDVTINANGVESNMTFIRKDGVLFIKSGTSPIIRFNGINWDNSVEHVKLKQYINSLFWFHLKLESRVSYITAPIETMFLPYYISQSVGWVYLYQSIGNWDYFKNFRVDYLDYYLGIENSIDRSKKHELERELKKLILEQTFYIETEQKNLDLQVSKLTDETFTEKSLSYIEEYRNSQKILIEREQEYIVECNKLNYYTERVAILSKIKRNHKKQIPDEWECPVCSQKIQYSLPELYKYIQNENDTKSELQKCTDKLTESQSSVNSILKDIEERKKDISLRYNVFRDYFDKSISMDSWINNKSNIRLAENIEQKLWELTKEISKIKKELEQFKTEEDIIKLRNQQNIKFENIFINYLNELNVKVPTDLRYTKLYNISAFPSQWVELHKTLMAYHFAFNKLIASNDNIHRFPFMLDAIFKEDIELINKDIILDFISKYRPTDTQLFISIAEAREKEDIVNEYNNKYFNNNANLICIGEGDRERSFLEDYKWSESLYLEGTFAIIHSSNFDSY